MAGTSTYRTTLRALRGAQKAGHGVSLYSRYVNRPLGRCLAAAAYRAGLVPHQVTALSAAFSYGALAVVALFPPSLALALVVYPALVLGFALDSADGQLARLRGEARPVGEWLDHVVDCAKITALHTVVLISFYRFFSLPSDGWLLVPLLFQLVAVVIFFGGLLTDKLTPPRPPDAPPRPPPSRLRAVALLPADYGIVCMVFLLLGVEGAFLTGYALLCVAQLVFCAAFLVKWYRQLAALSPPRPA